MSMKEAMEGYFKRLEKVWKKCSNSYPMAPYEEKSKLFVSEVDDEGYAEWLPTEIKKIKIQRASELNDELVEFFSSYYYMQMGGRYKQVSFYFCNMYSNKLINNEINAGIKDGHYYFPKKSYFCLGGVNYKGMDDYLAFYDIKKKMVYIYDIDKNKMVDWKYPLLEIINNMKPEL